MNREEARELFARSGLDYSVITQSNMQRLRLLINSRMTASECIKGTYRCRQRAVVRTGYAAIQCKSFYFDSRETITFNTDGFIGFAGWADDKNVQPVLAGFADWIKELRP